MSIAILKFFVVILHKQKRGLFYKNVQFDERLPKRAWTFFSLILKLDIFLTEIKNQNHLIPFFSLRLKI